jgi:hypothetical protein
VLSDRSDDDYGCSPAWVPNARASQPHACPTSSTTCSLPLHAPPLPGYCAEAPVVAGVCREALAPVVEERHACDLKPVPAFGGTTLNDIESTAAQGRCRMNSRRGKRVVLQFPAR